MESSGKSPQFVIHDLDQRIQAMEEDLSLLRRTRSWYVRYVNKLTTSGRDHGRDQAPPQSHTNAKPQTLSEGVELLLMEHGELHVDEMLKQLEERWQITVRRKNLTNTLSRWLSRRRKFKRVRTNTYALLGDTIR